jgi:hypothetical protein
VTRRKPPKGFGSSEIELAPIRTGVRWSRPYPRVTPILWDSGFPRVGSAQIPIFGICPPGRNRRFELIQSTSSRPVIRVPVFRNQIDSVSFISVRHSGLASSSGFCEIAETAGLADVPIPFTEREKLNCAKVTTARPLKLVDLRGDW